jgi:hypothetical protein
VARTRLDTAKAECPRESVGNDGAWWVADRACRVCGSAVSSPYLPPPHRSPAGLQRGEPSALTPAVPIGTTSPPVLWVRADADAAACPYPHVRRPPHL